MSSDIRLTEAEEIFLRVMARKIYPTAWGHRSFYTEDDQATAMKHVKDAFLMAQKSMNVRITKKRKNQDAVPEDQAGQPSGS